MGWKRRLRNIARNVPFAWALYGLYWRRRTRSELALRFEGGFDGLLNLGAEGPPPTLANPTSQLCTAAQCVEPAYAKWCVEIHSPQRLARKQWEFVFILQALERAGALQPGKKGVGFGCGKEPLASVLAKHGCRVVATDLDFERAAGKGWVDTFQHLNNLDALFDARLCPRKEFYERVSFRVADMNAIPADLRGFDFTWSACAFEHLGSLRQGMEFVKNAMDCLVPGGVAVHTTEFNLSSNDGTLEDPGCVLYRKRDIERLVAELTAAGHRVWPLNFHSGDLPVDRYIDAPPFRASPHLKMRLASYVTTSIGLVVEKSK